MANSYFSKEKQNGLKKDQKINAISSTCDQLEERIVDQKSQVEALNKALKSKQLQLDQLKHEHSLLLEQEPNAILENMKSIMEGQVNEDELLGTQNELLRTIYITLNDKINEMDKRKKTFVNEVSDRIFFDSLKILFLYCS